jgi:hypothetical protein
MRTLRTILLWAGLVFLLASVALALVWIEETSVQGGVSWLCEAGAASGTTECTVMTGSSELARLDLFGVTLPVVLALVGIGFLLAAIALGQSPVEPQGPQPMAPTAPYAYGQPQHRAPQPPTGPRPRQRD